MKRSLTLAAVFLLVGSAATGQVKAQQGVVAKHGPTEEREIVRSPMVLEVPVTLFRQTQQIPMALQLPVDVFDKTRAIQSQHEPLKPQTTDQIRQQIQNQDGPVTTGSVMEVTKYVCDAVSFRSLILQLAGPNSKSEFQLTVLATLGTDPGIDKLVNLTFEVFSKGELVAKESVKKIDAKDQKTASVETRLTIRQARLDPAVIPTLRITMQVLDNP